MRKVKIFIPKPHLNFAAILNLAFIYGLVALSIAVIVYAAVRIDSITIKQSENYRIHHRYHMANALFRQGTDILTNAVRRYVAFPRREGKYMKLYFDEPRKGRHRERAVEMIQFLPLDQSLKDSLTDAKKKSEALMNSEFRAMHLASLGDDESHAIFHEEIKQYPSFRPDPGDRKVTDPKKRLEMARTLLWDENYTRTKDEIYECLANGLDAAGKQAMARHTELRKELVRMLSLSAAALVVLVAAVCGLFIYRRNQHLHVIEAQAEENAKMNVQLREERDKAIKAEKARSYFFSTVSHDIRTPLNSIIGFSEMLQLGIDDPEEKERALEAIITSGQTLLELINDVLDLSKLESGKMELHPVPTDIADLVRKVTVSFETATSRTSVPLRTEIGKMPFLKLDPQRIRQILFNLIGNAVKFTAHGSITVRASYEDGIFTLSVIDTGCGISPENIGKLMSPYVQLHTHDTAQGTGLGLAICKQLSAQMKGTLELESEVGKGSVFRLRIPNVEAFTEKESEAYFSEHAEHRVQAHLDASVLDKRILVADDQKLNRRILQTMLARLGFHNVLTAGDGKEALEILNEAGNVDLVLTDMSMPVMDGAALVKAIRQSPRLAATPVYVITADVEMKDQYESIGFDDMLVKPVTLDKLKELLAKYSTRGKPTDDDAAQA